MAKYIVVRLLEMIAMLVLGSIACFVFIQALPGSAAQALYGANLQKLSEVERLRIEQNLGFDTPVVTQYLNWLANVVRGDFGWSNSFSMDVQTMLMNAMIPTFTLISMAALISIFLSLLLGIVSGLKEGSLVDRIVFLSSFICLSFPPFWLALLFMLLFGVFWQVLPLSGMGDGSWSSSLIHSILPASVLALTHLAYSIRLLRNHIAVVKEQDFVWSLQARGVKTSILFWKHILPNSLIPYVQYMGTMIAGLLAGAVTIETIFSWQGIGRLSLQAAKTQDYPLLMAILICSMVIVLVGSFVMDLVSAAIDPHVRRQLISAR